MPAFSFFFLFCRFLLPFLREQASFTFSFFFCQTEPDSSTGFRFRRHFISSQVSSFHAFTLHDDIAFDHFPQAFLLSVFPSISKSSIASPFPAIFRCSFHAWLFHFDSPSRLPACRRRSIFSPYSFRFTISHRCMPSASATVSLSITPLLCKEGKRGEGKQREKCAFPSAQMSFRPSASLISQFPHFSVLHSFHFRLHLFSMLPSLATSQPFRFSSPS